MIVCIEVNTHFNQLLLQLKTQVATLKQPIGSSHYNRTQNPTYPSNHINILSKGNIRLEYCPDDSSPTPSQNSAVLILEKGDLIPAIDANASFKLCHDGAIEIQHYQCSQESLALLQTSQAIFLELFAAQIPQQECFTPDVSFFKADDIILNKDASGETLHTLVEGHACAEIDGLVVGEIKSGESFGVVAALTNGKRSANVRAISQCMVMSVPADKLEKMIKHNPHLSLNIMKSLANNLLQANQTAVVNHDG